MDMEGASQPLPTQGANATTACENGELSRQEVERHKLPASGRWFWRLRGNGEDANSRGLDESLAAHPTDAPAATWDNVRNNNSGSKIFGRFDSRAEFAAALLQPCPRTVQHGYELIRRGMDVKAFADFDSKLADDAPVDALHTKARESFRAYLALLRARCQAWIGVDPIMYVSDCCRLIPGGYKASFHVTITNVVFANVNLKDNWMHSLFLIAESDIKPDPSVYNSDIRSMRAVTHSKKSSPDAPLTMDYDLSSPTAVRDSLLPTLITYLEDCPSRVTLAVHRDGIQDRPRFKNAFTSRLTGSKRKAGASSAAPASKRAKPAASLEYNPSLTDNQKEWAETVHGLLRLQLLPQLSAGLSGQQVRVQPCSGVDTHSQELRFTTKMIGPSRVCFLDPSRQKVHASNNTSFFVPDAPYDGAETPINETCMSTKCKGHARGTVGYIARCNGVWRVRANPLFLPVQPSVAIVAPTHMDVMDIDTELTAAMPIAYSYEHAAADTNEQAMPTADEHARPAVDEHAMQVVATEEHARPAVDEHAMPVVATEDQAMPAAATDEHAMPVVATEEHARPAVDEHAMPVVATEEQAMPAAATNEHAMPAVATEEPAMTAAEEPAMQAAEERAMPAAEEHAMPAAEEPVNVFAMPDDEMDEPSLEVRLEPILGNLSRWITGLRFSAKAARLLAHIGVSAAEPDRVRSIWQTALAAASLTAGQRRTYETRWAAGLQLCSEENHCDSYDYVAELRRLYLLDDRRRVAQEKLTYAEVKDFIEYGLGIFALENPIGYIQTNMDQDSYEVICETKLKVLLRHFQYTDEKDDEFVPFSTRWLNDSQKRFYRRMEFNPRSTGSSRHVFNTFSGFRASKLRPVSPELEQELVRPFCDHLRNVIVGGVDAHAEYLLDYMAALVQRPHMKSQVMILIYGGQGIGKGSLIDFLRKFVLGEKWTQQIQNVDLDLFGQFSSRENTILMQIDEMDDARKHQSALKNLTTADMIRCEKKNVMKEMAKNYLNVIATTNNLTSIPVESTDRRYAFFHAKLAVSPPIPGETVEMTQERRATERAAYFDALWGNLNGVDTPRAIYQMLVKRDLSHYQSENAFQLHRPRTAFYKAQQAASIDLPHRFISAMVNTHHMQDLKEKVYKGDAIVGKWTTYVKEKEPDILKWPWAPVKHALQNLAGVDCKVSNGVRYIINIEELLHDLQLKNLHDPELYLPHTTFADE